jgi:hypothetical protein
VANAKFKYGNPAVCALRLFRPEEEIIEFLEGRTPSTDFIHGLSPNDQPYNGLLLCKKLHDKFDDLELWLDHVFCFYIAAANAQAPQAGVEDGEHCYRLGFHKTSTEKMPVDVKLDMIVTFAWEATQRKRWEGYKERREQRIKDFPETQKEYPGETCPPPPLGEIPFVSPPPKRAFLDLHAAVCRVKRASGAADVYDDATSDDDDLAAPVLEEVNHESDKLLQWKMGYWHMSLDEWDVDMGE